MNELQSSSESEHPENHEGFYRRISILPDADRLDLGFAYEMAKSGHRGQWREGPDRRYFEHARDVFNILWDELFVTGKISVEDAVTIGKAALVHDIGEDTALFSNPTHFPYNEWRRIAWDRCRRNFGAESADLILAVTIPVVDEDVKYSEF